MELSPWQGIEELEGMLRRNRVLRVIQLAFC